MICGSALKIPHLSKSHWAHRVDRGNEPLLTIPVRLQDSLLSLKLLE